MSMFKLAARRSRQKGSFSSRQSDNVTILTKKTLLLPTTIFFHSLTTMIQPKDTFITSGSWGHGLRLPKLFNVSIGCVEAIVCFLVIKK